MGRTCSWVQATLARGRLRLATLEAGGPRARAAAAAKTVFGANASAVRDFNAAIEAWADGRCDGEEPTPNALKGGFSKGWSTTGDRTLGRFVRHVFGDSYAAPKNSAASAHSTSYGQYLTLESDLFAQFPQLWENNIGPLPEFLLPRGFYAFEKDTLKPWEKQLGAANRSLLLGGTGSRSTLHQDGRGWTSWIAVFRGTKLAKVWPGSIDARATFADPAAPTSPSEEGDADTNDSSLDPFAEVPPTLTAAWARGGRFGDSRYDFSGWEAAARVQPPMLPAECVVRAGDILVTHDFWHAVINLEPTVGVTSNFIDKAAVPAYLWRSLAAMDKTDAKEMLGEILCLPDGEALQLLEHTIGHARQRCAVEAAAVARVVRWLDRASVRAALVKVADDAARQGEATELVKSGLHERFMTACGPDDFALKAAGGWSVARSALGSIAETISGTRHEAQQTRAPATLGGGGAHGVEQLAALRAAGLGGGTAPTRGAIGSGWESRAVAAPLLAAPALAAVAAFVLLARSCAGQPRRRSRGRARW